LFGQHQLGLFGGRTRTSRVLKHPLRVGSNTPAEAVRDPRVVARRETVPLGHPTIATGVDVMGMGVPITFSDATTGFAAPAPGLGEHNDLVYGEWLGYSREHLQGFGTLASSEDA
jgi:crotonobetainyl-CoA:carnitine CoA-transferase CaiB-like acyl-CoA transferase